MAGRKNGYLGIILIVVGLAILLREHYYIDEYFLRSYGLLLIGLLGLFRAFSSRPRGGIYLFSILTLVGLYYILGDAGVYDIERGLTTSVFTLIAGAALFPRYLFGGRNWKDLLYGTLILAVGAIFLLFHLRVIPYYTFETIIIDYWPVALIAIGLAYLVNGLWPRGGGNGEGSAVV